MRSGILVFSLLLACIGNQGVQAQQYTFQRGIGRAPLVGDPAGIAVDKRGTVYVTDRVNGRILTVAPGQRSGMNALKSGQRFEQPATIAVAPNGTLVVAGGRLLMKLGSIGNKPGFFNQPVGIASSPGGALVISDASNARIQVFAPSTAGIHGRTRKSGNQTSSVAGLSR